MCYSAVHHKTKNVRFWKHLDRDSFRKSLLDSQLCGGTDTLSTMSPSALFDLYDGTLRRIVDEHLPVEEVSVRDRPLTPWFDNDCRAAKQKVRMLERRYRRTHSAMDCMAWVRQLERKRDLLERKEERYWNEKICLERRETQEALVSSQQPPTERPSQSTSSVRRHFRRITVGFLSRQGRESTRRDVDCRSTNVHQAHGRIIRFVSGVLHEGSSKVPHSISS